MRRELTNAGARELVHVRRCRCGPAREGDRDDCGELGMCCAAGKARPGIAIALQHARRPDVVGTVFAGADIDATAWRARPFAPYPPSSPSVGSLRDGKLVYMLERRQIETRDAASIASMLRAAFDEHC